MLTLSPVDVGQSGGELCVVCVCVGRGVCVCVCVCERVDVYKIYFKLSPITHAFNIHKLYIFLILTSTY